MNNDRQIPVLFQREHHFKQNRDNLLWILPASRKQLHQDLLLFVLLHYLSLLSRTPPLQLQYLVTAVLTTSTFHRKKKRHLLFFSLLKTLPMACR